MYLQVLSIIHCIFISSTNFHGVVRTSKRRPESTNACTMKEYCRLVTVGQPQGSVSSQECVSILLLTRHFPSSLPLFFSSKRSIILFISYGFCSNFSEVVIKVVTLAKRRMSSTLVSLFYLAV